MAVMAARNALLVLALVLSPSIVLGGRCHKGLHTTPLGDAKLTALADDPEACQACMWGIRLLDDALCDRGLIYSVVNVVNQHICKMASDKQQCESLSSALVPVAMAYIQGAIVPGQICSNAGVCGKQVLSYPQYMQARQLPNNGIMECQFCRMVVAKVKEVLDNPTSEQQVLDEALKVCKSLDASMQDACADFVNTNGAAFFAFIDTMEPLQVCEAAGACMAQLIRNHPLPRLPAPLATSLARIQRASAPNPANNLCDTCKIVVLEAHQMITNPKTQKQIEAFLEQACSSFGSAQDECQALMEEYLPLALEVLAEYLDPTTLCSQIGYCTAKPSAFEQLIGALRVRNAPLPRVVRVHATQ